MSARGAQHIQLPVSGVAVVRLPMHTHTATPYSTGFPSRLFTGWESQYVQGYVGLSASIQLAHCERSPVSVVPADPLLTPDDGALVAAMARADERAAGVLYDRHGGIMYGLALRMVADPADAEEVVLDAFAQAWKEADRYDTSRGSVLGWLTTIVRTRALDTIRSRGRRTKLVDRASQQLSEPAAMGEPVPPTDQAVEQQEIAQAVGAALQELPDVQRRAIELAFYEGLTHQEVAERLREPLGTIKTRIRSGMLKLRDMLDALAPEHSS